MNIYESKKIFYTATGLEKKNKTCLNLVKFKEILLVAFFKMIQVDDLLNKNSFRKNYRIYLCPTGKNRLNKVIQWMINE